MLLRLHLFLIWECILTHTVFQSKINEHKELNDKIQAALKGESLDQGLEACEEALKGKFYNLS